MKAFKPIPRYQDPSGRQIYTGDVYANDLGDGTLVYRVCIWFPELFRYAWLDLHNEYPAYCQMESFDRIYNFSEGITEPHRFFQGEETYTGNIYLNPELAASKKKSRIYNL